MIKKKIPKNAKLVYDGRIFKIYSYKQRMQGGSYLDFEVPMRPDSVFILPVVNNQIWLSESIEPRYKRFGMFGGRVEKGEKLIDTAKRELLEEAGLKSNDIELLAVFDINQRFEYNCHVFVARSCKRVQNPYFDSGERVHTKKFDFERFLLATRKIRYAEGHYFCQFRESQVKKRWLYKKLFGQLKNVRSADSAEILKKSSINRNWGYEK